MKRIAQVQHCHYLINYGQRQFPQAVVCRPPSLALFEKQVPTHIVNEEFTPSGIGTMELYG